VKSELASDGPPKYQRPAEGVGGGCVRAADTVAVVVRPAGSGGRYSGRYSAALPLKVGINLSAR
jgi:hypothetical protein